MNSPPIRAVADDLRHTVERASERLFQLSDREAAHRPAPGKWSRKEILGHLIDSAANNHQRFVRAAFQEDLLFPGYAQDEWVALQHYQERDWREIVTLWRSYNLQLAHVLESLPRDVLEHVHRRHNLHQIAWAPLEEHAPVTLTWFAADYVGHLKHHLRQAGISNA
jgi:hypothetical protein